MIFWLHFTNFFIIIGAKHPTLEQIRFDTFCCKKHKVKFFWCAPFCYLFFLSFQLNEPGLGAGIDPGKALIPFSSSIG